MKEARAVSVDRVTMGITTYCNNHLPCPTLYLLDQGISS